MNRIYLKNSEEDALINLLTAYLATEEAQEDLPELRSILAKLTPTCRCGHRVVAHPRRHLQAGFVPGACAKCDCDLYRVVAGSGGER